MHRAHPLLRPGPHVVGHRGAAGLHPENTLQGFRAARALGVHAVEFDVHATADGHCVCIHDAAVDRTTNGTGAVAAMTLAHLRTLDAGYRFTTDGGRTYPFRGQGLVVPTIGEALAELAGLPLIIELKTGAAQAPLFDALERAGVSLDVVASGEKDAFRTQFARHPGPTSGSTEQLRRWIRLHTIGLGRIVRPRFDMAAVPETWEGRRIVTRRFIRGLHAHGVTVFVWTVNEPTDMRRLLEWGVDGIITDRPDMLRQVVGG